MIKIDVVDYSLNELKIQRVQYTVQDTVQYTVQDTVQYAVQYTVQYIVQYKIVK
jgi:hypothetical protein